MEIKRLNADALSAPEILSLLEIARSFCAAKPDWPQLRRRLGAGEAWGFFDGASLAGFAVVAPAAACFADAAQLTMLNYRWEYNDETSILRMLTALAQVYRGCSHYLLLDVNRRHELNLELYRRFGFQNAMVRSPGGGENILLIADLTALPAAEQREKA